MTSQIRESGAPSPIEKRGTTGGSVPEGLQARPIAVSAASVVSENSVILQQEAIEYFTSFVQIFGLPRSIGQIYGLLFVSVNPLTMDDIVTHLEISKGSASQGLALLKSLGAVTSHSVPTDRREHFIADLNVSRIVRHFVENRLQPRLENGEQRLKSMLHLARLVRETEKVQSSSVLSRIQALQKWQKRGRGFIPLLLRWLKR